MPRGKGQGIFDFLATGNIGQESVRDGNEPNGPISLKNKRTAKEKFTMKITQGVSPYENSEVCRHSRLSVPAQCPPFSTTTITTMKENAIHFIDGSTAIPSDPLGRLL